MVPMSIGMKVVIAKSFARIFRQNMINNGVVPLIFSDAADYESIQAGDTLYIDLFHQQVEQNLVSVENRSQNRTFETVCDLTARERELLFQGGILRSLQVKYTER
jgi:aconitate hydratase